MPLSDEQLDYLRKIGRADDAAAILTRRAERDATQTSPGTAPEDDRKDNT